MKKIVMFLFAVLLTAGLSAQTASDDFGGKWKTDDGAVVLIEKVDNYFVGKDLKTGTSVIKKMTFSDGKWQGEIYNPKRDITANFEASLDADLMNIIAKKGFITKEIIWTKL